MDNFIQGIFGGLILGLVFGSIVTRDVAYSRGKKKIQQEAIEHGYAEMVVDKNDVNTRPVFTWVEQEKKEGIE